METLESLLRNYLQANEKRLDRIESKIDRVSDTLIILARVEEKIVELEKSRDKQGTRLGTIENQNATHEDLINKHERAFQICMRALWIAATAGITVYVGYIISTYV